MLTRRNFTLSLASLACAAPAIAKLSTPAPKGGAHSVLMLNADCGDANVVNVFQPAILHVDVGDQVTFLATDAGHNSASKRGMLPDGAEAWNGAVDEEITVTFALPGIYGYICLPHYEWGMVGLVIAGNDLSNLKTAKKVRHPGDARKNFRALFAELEVPA